MIDLPKKIAFSAGICYNHTVIQKEGTAYG